ncbi:hypothetical protein F5148DRAFT_315756 [Russula earlei]|uniref:Uncharacterized protein n=1 Tax=Russula earlei TaxID=71964 RepID=A0ACC0U235_9AGAM|nr:hypothetical protein F5148DRAFT_315756 [Russula earlei]
MFLFHTKEHAQRKYIDLIKEASAKWPNWDPSRNLHPGDFGTVEKKTGDFIVEGNIYTHVDIAKIANQYPPIQAPDVDNFQIPSFEVRGSEIRPDDGEDSGHLLRSRWQFNSKRGAVLLMHRPRMTRVPDEFFKASLHLPVLKGKCVVYQVWNCPGFYMYLSNRSSEQVTVSLRAKSNTSAGPDVHSQPPLTLHWSAEGSAGVRQYAYKADAVYTPLFCLKSIRRPLLRRDQNSYGKAAWHETDVPWDDLDGEGVTEPEPIYDNGPDDDDDDDDD